MHENMTTTPDSPPVIPLNIHYALEIDSVQVGVFNHISGGEMEIDLIQHRVVGSTGGLLTLNIPGPVKIDPITLEGGYGKSKELYQWFLQASGGDVFGARKNATISLNAYVDDKYKPVIQWHLFNVWPTKISGLDFGQDSTTWARFSITLVCEAIEREDLV